MKLIFLGTGGAWALPELNCGCWICREMRQREEKRQRTALLLSGKTNLLIDCGPDIARQLSRHGIGRIDALLLTHEHGDHYLGMDELYSYKRCSPTGTFVPIPVFASERTWEVVSERFGYMEERGVIKAHEVKPGRPHVLDEFEILPFKTDHGPIAKGSVGYVIRTRGSNGKEIRLVYTSDFVDLPETPPDLFYPDYLIIQSFWLNEPSNNIPNHMSFQRALDFIEQWKPVKETFIVHIGDGDPVPGDPANTMAKKQRPADPLRTPGDGLPYPVPLNQEQWQQTVDRILSDYRLSHKIIVASDALEVSL